MPPRILLIKPDSNSHVAFPPLGLLYLAGAIIKKNKNTEIKILDFHLNKFDEKKFQKLLLDFKPNMLGITAFSFEIINAFNYCGLIKKTNDKIITIIGGCHASCFPEHILSNRSVDYSMKGEVEISFPILIDSIIKEKLDHSTIPGLIYRSKKANKIIVNKPRYLLNLDDVEPAWDLIDLKSYPKLYLNKRYPVAPIITSRGCPYRCKFCSASEVSGLKWRYRSVKSIIKEIKKLYHEYGVKEIMIWDDNFTLNRSRVEEFCRALLKEKMNLIWSCPNGVRLNSLDFALLKLMKKSGCYSLCLGIESGSQRVLNNMSKNLKISTVKKIVPLIKKAGIRTQGFFIIGYPSETIEDVNKTIDLALKLPLTRASFSLYQPLPGSESYSELLDGGYIAPNELNWELFDYSKVNYKHPNISAKQLLNLQRKAIMLFYLRPKILFNFVLDNLSISQLKEILNMVKLYILKIHR